MGNECFLSFTTSHLPMAEQILAKYRLRIVHPPVLPLKRKPNPDGDAPEIEPNLWMWVNPNIVYPPGKLEVRDPTRTADVTSKPSCPPPSLEEQDASSSEGTGVESPLPSCSEQPPPEKRKRFASSPGDRELTEEEEAEDQDDSSSVALLPPLTRASLQSRRLQQTVSLEGRLWSRPPLNYFHLIALALSNSPPSGLNVQQIYSFTRFQKVPVSMQGEASPRPRSCLWKLTEEGRRRFAEEARALVSTQLESIQQCMSQPDLMPFLFRP
ncbi:PREDICTED: forkhead box protein R1 isoform X1 [Chinchilla lanigera]|uniref:forkhead box protein R1 isoform X1 n=1 Tax=Chinchilla lanigera TaxID=34839 RepID=UPI00069818E9|nr:PREDICTED: forkhead box protein R1 isoform X1 [Chinchilla lanigera]